jgi:clan AA aspartic protease (TIGR02281 family)
MLLILVGLNTVLPCFAQAELYQKALKEYKAGHYREAGTLFNDYLTPQLDARLSLTEQLPDLNTNPSIAYAILYEAICLHQLGDYADASVIYKVLAQRYKGTPLGAEAQKSLNRPEIAQALNQKFPGTVRGAHLDSLPRATWIPFKKFGNLMLVEGYINGRKTGMLFDTGAAGCLFSTAHLKSLGLDQPKGEPTVAVAGVGTQKQTPAWLISADLQLGSILRRQFPVQVNDNPLNYPLLGVNFFEGMEYTIDNQANVIQFKTASSDNFKLPNNKMTITVDSSSRYVYNVPFTEINGAIVVNVKVAGKDFQMMIDTGTDVCLFTATQLKKLGTMPRFTGRTLNCKGATGYMKAPVCIFDNVELGPIKGPLTCLVTDQSNLPFPLLGQSFLKGWQFTIDHSNHLIKLIRK